MFYKFTENAVTRGAEINLTLCEVSNLHISTVVLLFLLEKCESRLQIAKDSHFFNKKVIVCLIDTLRVDV